MMEKIESVVIIISTIIITGITTISAFFSMQKQFRIHIDNLFDSYDKCLKTWISQTLEDYYIPLDDRLKSQNIRIKVLEKK